MTSNSKLRYQQNKGFPGPPPFGTPSTKYQDPTKLDALSSLCLDPIEQIDSVCPDENTARKLVEGGIFNLFDLASKSGLELSECAHLELEEARSLLSSALSHLHQSGIIQKRVFRASALLRKRRSLTRFGTGASALDELLHGGIESQAITELYGEYGSGKTQICHTLCALPPADADSKALYIDTEGTFKASRLFQISENRGLDPKKTLARILVARVTSSEQFELLFRQLGQLVGENRVRLLVVDSIIALHRAEFAGGGDLCERQQRLNVILFSLRKVAESTNCAVVVTNQVSVLPSSFGNYQVKAVGGNILGHGTTYRVYLKKAGRERIARIVDSPYHPVSEARFVVTNRGCSDSPKRI